MTPHHLSHFMKAEGFFQKFLDHVDNPLMIDFVEAGNTLVRQLVEEKLLLGDLVDNYLKADETLLYSHALKYQNLPINELMRAEDGSNGSFRQKFVLVSDVSTFEIKVNYLLT